MTNDMISYREAVQAVEDVTASFCNAIKANVDEEVAQKIIMGAMLSILDSIIKTGPVAVQATPDHLL